MSINIGDNFSYLGKKFLDDREHFDTVAKMKACNDVPNGFITYCDETNTRYEYHADNQDDATLGKWRVFKSVPDINFDEYVTQEELEEAIKDVDVTSQLENYATKDDIPTKTSELENDSGYLTEHQDISHLVTQDEFNELELIETSPTEPTDEDVVIWINTSKDTPTDVIARINDNTVASNTVWSSEKVDNTLDEYATKIYVSSEIAKAQLEGEEIDLSGYATKDDIPTKTSELTNDSGFLTSVPNEYVTDGELNDKGYLTEHQNISHLATKDEIPTKVSELENDKGYLTSIPSEYVTDSELTTKGYATTNYVDDAVANLSELKMNIVNGLTFANAYINYNNGDYVSGGSAYACQEYIPVISGATYEVNGVSNIVRIAYYDSSKTYINQYIDNTPTFNFTPPSNVSYIRVHVDSTSNAWQNLSIESEMEDYIRAYINNATSGGSGNVDLSLYALKTDLHSHSNKTVIDTITSTMITKWNQSIPFNDTYVSDCNTWLTNGYVKTGANQTSNLPSACTGTDRWGILFFIAENVTQGTGTQMYFPTDGTYKGRIFTRSLTNMNQTPTVGEWNLVSISNVGTSSLTNPTISDVSASSLANESTMPTISDINISTNEGYLNGLLSKMEILEEKIKTLEEKIKTLEEKE